MADDRKGDDTFLRRWSRRKHAAAHEAPPVAVAPDEVVAPPPERVVSAPTLQEPPVGGDQAGEAATELPAVETLSFESDFTAFLKPGVDAATRQQALKKLFTDARFNVMDGLDVYIGDYSKFEPIAPDVVKQLAHARYLFDPPRTRVNAQGHVEDVVEEKELADAGEPVEAASDDARVSSDDSPACGSDAERARGDVPADVPSTMATARDESR